LHTKILVQQLLGQRDRPIGLQALLSKKTVLEVGCGPSLRLPGSEYGVFSTRFAVGIDFSFEFLRSAFSEDVRGDSIALVQADAANLPFRDGSFDIVIAAFCIHHVVSAPA